MLEDYPLEGKTLDEWLDEQLGVDRKKKAKKKPPSEQEQRLKKLFNFVDTHIVSRKKLTVSGLEAVEVVTEANYTVMEVDIKKGDRVIRVSMRALREEFPKYEAAYRKALASIKIKNP